MSAYRTLSLLSQGPQDSGKTPRRGWMKVTKNGPQLTDRAPIEIAIVCYPGSQATSIHGLTDLFTYANYFARVHATSSDVFLRVTHWRQRADGAALECE